MFHRPNDEVGLLPTFKQLLEADTSASHLRPSNRLQPSRLMLLHRMARNSQVSVVPTRATFRVLAPPVVSSKAGVAFLASAVQVDLRS